MNPLYRRGLSALLSLLLAGQMIPASRAVSAPAAAPENVAITQENFPDPKFRQWLTDDENVHGYGADGLFTPEELSGIRRIDVSHLGLTSLEGIEVFTALERLYCGGNQLTELDVSRNRELIYLYAAWNQLEQLDLSGLDRLVSLNVDGNRLTSLLLDGCTALEVLYCQGNRLTALDVSDSTGLVYLSAFDNQLTSIDLTALADLEFVNLDTNYLTALDLSGNTGLSTAGSGFAVQNNFLQTLTLPAVDGLQVSPAAYAQQEFQTGYERVSWFSDAGYAQPVTGAVPAEGQTLYAKRLPNDYTVSFSANGGSGSMAPQAALWDAPLTLSANQFTRRGYVFAGWENTYGDGQTYTDGQEVTNLAGKTQGSRVTLYAQWTPVTYTVTFDANTGSGSMSSQGHTYDQAVVLPDCTLTAPADREFAGWALEPDGPVRYRDGGSVQNLSATQGDAVTLYAVWREPIADQYREQLDTAFSQYQADDYTTQDWDTLTECYADALAAIGSAGDAGQMQEICDQAQAAMAQVPTALHRAQAAADAWRSAHSTVLQQVDGQAVDESSAAQIQASALQAAGGLTVEFVTEVHQDLTAPADQERVAALAEESVRNDLQGLSRLADAAAWAGKLDGLSTRPLAEVTSLWQSSYDAAVLAAEDHTAQLAAALTDALQSRAALARQKQQAVAQLHMDYQGYDLEQYSEAGRTALAEILRTGLANLESADSSGAVTARLAKAQRELKSVPDLEQEAHPPVWPFTDVSDTDWCYDAVAYVHERGIMNGYSQDTFGPQHRLSRAQLAQILYNLEGRPQTDSVSGSYGDLTPGAWYEDAISWAVKSGVLSGYGDGNMRPNQAVSRQQLAAMLYRYAQHKGSDVSQSADLDGFQDRDQVAAYAQAPLQWAVAAGIVNGTSADTLSPNGSASRAQTAVMLMRFCDFTSL